MRLLTAVLSLLICLGCTGPAFAEPVYPEKDFVRERYYELILSRSWVESLCSPIWMYPVPSYQPESMNAKAYLCDLDGNGTEELVITGQFSMADSAFVLYGCTEKGCRLLAADCIQGDSAVLACPEAGTLRFSGFHGGWSTERILQIKQGCVADSRGADGEGELRPEMLNPEFAGEYVRLESRNLTDLSWLWRDAEEDVNAAALRRRDRMDPEKTISIGSDFCRVKVPAWWTGHFFVLASEPWKYDVIHVDTETGIRYWLFSIGLSDTVHSPEQVYQVVPEDWSQRDGNVTWSDRIRCIGTWTGGVAYAVEPAGTEVDYAKMDALTRAMTETVQTGDIYSSAQVNEEIYYSFGLLP